MEFYTCGSTITHCRAAPSETVRLLETGKQGKLGSKRGADEQENA
jgi:hypothetical protein